MGEYTHENCPGYSNLSNSQKELVKLGYNYRGSTKESDILRKFIKCERDYRKLLLTNEELLQMNKHLLKNYNNKGKGQKKFKITNNKKKKKFKRTNKNKKKRRRQTRRKQKNNIFII